MMGLPIFLDDLRDVTTVYPGANPEGWRVCRSAEEAKQAVLEAWPRFVSLDHDLGDNVPTGMDFVKWLVELDLDTGGMPADFDFRVHSANPAGAANMQGLLSSYLKHRN
jgi:hypothetical protein